MKQAMNDFASSMDEIDAALPRVREAVRREVAERIAAGEEIARLENGEVVGGRPASVDLEERRRELLSGLLAGARKQQPVRRKSVA